MLNQLYIDYNFLYNSLPDNIEASHNLPTTEYILHTDNTIVSI